MLFYIRFYTWSIKKVVNLQKSIFNLIVRPCCAVVLLCFLEARCYEESVTLVVVFFLKNNKETPKQTENTKTKQTKTKKNPQTKQDKKHRSSLLIRKI